MHTAPKAHKNEVVNGARGGVGVSVGVGLGLGSEGGCGGSTLL
jgi:hypothetical protein